MKLVSRGGRPQRMTTTIDQEGGGGEKGEEPQKCASQSGGEPGH